MVQTRFPSFSKASAFAKSVAQRDGHIVRLRQDGDDWVLETAEQSPHQASSSGNVEVPPQPLPALTTLGVNLPQPASKRVINKPRISSPTIDNASRTTTPINLAPGERVCVECTGPIPAGRVTAIPGVTRCVRCQSEFESAHDVRMRIDEGIAGTREDNTRLRGQLWSDMRNRGRGK